MTQHTEFVPRLAFDILHFGNLLDNAHGVDHRVSELVLFTTKYQHSIREPTLRSSQWMSTAV